MVYALAYNNYDMLAENAIGTWSGEQMKQTYVLLDYYGQPWTGNGGGTYTNYSVNQPYAIFAVDALAGDKNARAKLLGSIAYIAETDVFKADREIFVTNVDSVEIKDTAAVFAPGGIYSGKHTFGLYGLTTNVANGGETNERAESDEHQRRFPGQSTGDGWQQANIFQSGDDALTASDSVYPGARAGPLPRVRRRNADGSAARRGHEPAHHEAMVQSTSACGVTQTIEQILRPIPRMPIGRPSRPRGRSRRRGQRSADPHRPPHLQPVQPMAHAGFFSSQSEPIKPIVSLEIAPGQTVNSRDSVQNFGLGSAVGSLGSSPTRKARGSAGERACFRLPTQERWGWP
jgi:hypothetical protein